MRLDHRVRSHCTHNCQQTNPGTACPRAPDRDALTPAGPRDAGECPEAARAEANHHEEPNQKAPTTNRVV
jgi:hypothetical protein